MRFSISEEQEALRQTVRRFVREQQPVSEVRRLMETEAGFDRSAWRAMAQTLGVAGLRIPERHGGSQLGMVEQAIVFEELGHGVVGSPSFATVALGVSAILHGGNEEDWARWLPDIAAGKTTATLAATTPTLQTVAVRDGNSYRLDGVHECVSDGHTADVLIIAAGGVDAGLFVLEGGAPGVCRKAVESLDSTRKLANLELCGARAQRLGAPDARQALARALDEARVCIAAEAVGGARRCLAQAVEYAKLRVQFGRPIGSFQAIKHRAADMHVGVEAASAVLQDAARVADHGSAADLHAAAAMAKSLCCDVYRKVSADNIHVHGGIGFTWEHDAHLYFKRAASLSYMFGDSTAHRKVVAAHLGL